MGSFWVVSKLSSMGKGWPLTATSAGVPVERAGTICEQGELTGADIATDQEARSRNA